MKTHWLASGILCITLSFGVALSAAYPETVWLDTDMGELSYNYDLEFDVEPALLRASAVKGPCTLGSRLGCALQ